jgi:hypothetical protein
MEVHTRQPASVDGQIQNPSRSGCLSAEYVTELPAQSTKPERFRYSGERTRLGCGGGRLASHFLSVGLDMPFSDCERRGAGRRGRRPEAPETGALPSDGTSQLKRGRTREGACAPQFQLHRWLKAFHRPGPRLCRRPAALPTLTSNHTAESRGGLRFVRDCGILTPCR